MTYFYPGGGAGAFMAEEPVFELRAVSHVRYTWGKWILGSWPRLWGGRIHEACGVELPLWTLLLAMLGFAAHVWLRKRRLDRALAGAPVCGKCSYDLTGNVSGRCPECGTPTALAENPAGSE
jgi:hypothetical protein